MPKLIVREKRAEDSSEDEMSKIASELREIYVEQE